jgi:hypothetical protein
MFVITVGEKNWYPSKKFNPNDETSTRFKGGEEIKTINKKQKTQYQQKIRHFKREI